MGPVVALGTGAFVPETGTVSTDIEWLIVGFLGHLVYLPFIFLGNLIAKTLNFKRGSVLVLTMLAMGATRGFVVSLSAEYFNLVAEADFAWRILSAMFLTLGWYGVANAVVFEIKDYLRSLRSLRSELHRQKQYLEQSERDLQATRQDIRDETMKLIDLGLVQVETRGKGYEQIQSIANHLRNLVDEGLSPLIRRVQEQPTQANYIIAPYQRVSAARVVQRAFVEKPFFVGSAIFVQMIGSIASKIWGLGLLLALIDLAIVSLAILIAFSIGSIVNSWIRSSWGRLISNFVFLSIPASVAAITPFFLVSGSEFVAGVSASLFSNVFAASVLSAVGYAAKSEAQLTIDQLEEAIEQTSLARSRAEQLKLVERKRLERILHGSVQSSLRALALEIERTGEFPDKSRLDNFRQGVLDQITNPTHTNLVDFLRELKELWGASAGISFELDDEIPDLLLADRNAHVAVIEIIREVASNAMKHSRSTQLKFKVGRYHGVSESLGVLTISANFDGNAIIDTYPGNGLRTISELASHYSYHSDADGNHFSAEVPTSPQPSVATTGT